MVSYPSANRKETEVLKLILSITRAVIHDTRTRRGAMFRLLLAALLMLFAGATLMNDYLASHPLVFLLYWGACAWLTMAAVLLAGFDMLIIRAAGRVAQRELERQVLKNTDTQQDNSTNDTTQGRNRED
jgi:hypothetical protein